jgi:TP901 family phage tail tape measure protein
MANRNMKVSVLVELVDRLTAPLRGLTRGIAGIANSVGDLGRRIGLIGATFAAFSFMAPMQQAAAWDAQLRDIAITAGKTGGAAESMIGDLSKQYQKLAFMTGQTSDDVAKGAKTLISGNMATDLIERLMPTIARVATATGATITDTAKTVLSLSDTLKIPSEQMEAMLGKLAVAGKLGRFEFADMARALPELTAQMAKLGITGREAVESLGVNLQIAMIGTADPSQAATNLNNFLTKINAPEAIKKFEKELKVDLTGVMTDATAKGINPVEAVIEKMISKLSPHQAEIDKIMKKAEVSDKQREEQVRTLIAGTNVGKLYADMQVLGFILPMMQNIAKFKEFREQLKTAGVDTIVDDFATRMKGLQPQLNQFGVVASAVGNRIGLAFASNLPTAMNSIQDLLKSVDQVDKKLPGFVDGVLSWGGALLVLGAGLAILTPVVSALAGLFGLLISPVVLAAAAIGAAAWHIWSNWDQLGPEMGKIFGGLKQAAGGFGEMMSGLFTGDRERTITGARQMMDGLATALDGGWEVLKSLARGGVNAIDGIIGGMASSFDKLFGTDVAGSYARLKAAATDAWEGVKQSAFGAWEAIKAKGEELITWAQGLPARMIAAIGSIDLTNIIKWPALPKWLGGTAPSGPGEPGLSTMDGFNPTSAPAAPGSGIGGSAGFTRTSGGPAANSNVNVGGRIVVEAAEGTRVINVQSENPAVPVMPNRGMMLGRA